MPAVQKNYPIYKTLALEIFVECDPKEISNLRNALFNFYKLLEGTGDNNSPAGKEFYKYLIAVHLLNLKNIYLKKDMHSLYMRASISCLRYSDLVRMDKLFYDAGMASKKENALGYAFHILNKYMDIYEVIEDPDNN